MKLNLNRPSTTTAPKLQLNQQNASNNQADKIREEIYKELVEDMKNTAVELELTEENINSAYKRFKNLKIKKLVLFCSLVFFLLVLSVCAIFKTFFKHEYTGEEIAYLSNHYNNTTNFPIDGIYGYLSINIEQLLRENLSVQQNINDLKVGNVNVTKINLKNDYIANVYFYVDISTNIGFQIVSCVLPIYWDSENSVYLPAGKVIFTPNETSASSVERYDNPLLSFEEIEKDSKDNTEITKPFVDNFFMMLYSGQNITPYYSGNVDFDTNGLKYEGLLDYILYSDYNGNGYNAIATIKLSAENGIIYETIKYIKIDKKQDSWKISAIL